MKHILFITALFIFTQPINTQKFEVSFSFEIKGDSFSGNVLLCFSKNSSYI